MKVRTRDFIYTTDDLFFASTNYIHPKDRFISFLRYVPDENGDREKNGKYYSKVSSDEAYSYLRKNYPEYLYFCNVSQVEMMGVQLDKVKEIIKPEKRLAEIRKVNEVVPSVDPIIQKLIELSDFFHYKAGIEYNNLGISGSILPNLQKSNVSDIDFVVYGLKNHRIAMKAFEKFKNRELEIETNLENETNDKEINNKTLKKHYTKIALNGIQDSYWEKIYNKRIKDMSLTKKEFCWYENRKNNRGMIDGTLFDILATRNWNEIRGKWGETRYEPVGIAKIEAMIEDAIASFDNPATYKIKGLEFIEVFKGKEVPITEIASFTHTYSGQAIEGEKIIAKGKVERVLKESDQTKGANEESYRLIVGTTRESIDEYIKLKDNPLK